MEKETVRLFSPKTALVWFAVSALYFAWFGAVVGLRAEHILLWAVMVGAYFFSEKSRFWAEMMAVWAVYWMLYDSMRSEYAPGWPGLAGNTRRMP